MDDVEETQASGPDEKDIMLAYYRQLVQEKDMALADLNAKLFAAKRALAAAVEGTGVAKSDG